MAMEQAGVQREHIFIDRKSGKDFWRPAYAALVRRLKPGDAMIIKSVDRLGRNYREILEQWRIISKEKKTAIVVLDLPMLDTRNRSKEDLTGTVLANIVLQILSYVAETERNFIRQRQAEGIAAAMAKGVKFGRRKMERPPRFYLLKKRWKNGKISARAAARLLGITHRTFLTWARE